MEGQGDLVSRLMMGILRLTIGVLRVLLSPPDPPSRDHGGQRRFFKIFTSARDASLA